MSPDTRMAVNAIVAQPVRCACAKCEEAVQDVLRMHAMMCPGAKQIITRRIKRLAKVMRREQRRPMERERWAARRAS